MSVRSETYLLYGWLLDYADFKGMSEGKQEAFYDLPGGNNPEVGKVARLLDGMGGEYLAIGIVIGKAADDGEGMSPRIISETKMPENIHEAKDAVMFVLGSDKLLGEPAQILLTHFH